MSSVLHLGNVNFKSVDDTRGGEGSGVDNDESKKKLKIASDLLGIVSPEWFERALTITLLKDVSTTYHAVPLVGVCNRQLIFLWRLVSFSRCRCVDPSSLVGTVP